MGCCGLCAPFFNAHYEGFCKFAWDYYLSKLELTHVRRQDCVDHIARASLAREFKVMRGNLSTEATWEFCAQKFKVLMQGELTFDIKLETDSNLWPNVLIANSSSVGLACAVAQDHALKLKSLVARRNEIAHGRRMTISDLEEYQQYEHAAIVVMHELAISVIEAFESSAHLLTPPTSD